MASGDAASDEDLAADVLTELNWDPRVQAHEITVHVRDGVVTLGGWVDAYAKRRAATDAAHRIQGVKAVVNDIHVRLGASGTPTDAALTEVILSALEWNGLIPAHLLVATVFEGWVTLKGEVEWEYQRQEAERVVGRLKGVTGVTNVITLAPSTRASALREQVAAALSRNAHIDIGRVNVVVDDSAVILTGTVGSWAEREEVERAVWSAHGITSVDNRIVVSS
jgi:osmotically-inducible protein OsmY